MRPRPRPCSVSKTLYFQVQYGSRPAETYRHPNTNTDTAPTVPDARRPPIPTLLFRPIFPQTPQSSDGALSRARPRICLKSTRGHGIRAGGEIPWERSSFRRLSDERSMALLILLVTHLRWTPLASSKRAWGGNPDFGEERISRLAPEIWPGGSWGASKDSPTLVGAREATVKLQRGPQNDHFTNKTIYLVGMEIIDLPKVRVSGSSFSGVV